MLILHNIKVAILGDVGVGKTTYITRLLTGEFTKRYNATLSSINHLYPCNSTHGTIMFNIIDTAGNIMLDFYIRSDAFIIMFDLTSNISFRALSTHINNLIDSKQSDKPIIICGNKCDIKERKVDSESIRNLIASYKEQLKNIYYYDLSAKSNYNFEKPFRFIARTIINVDLDFTEQEAMIPPEVHIKSDELIDTNVNSEVDKNISIDSKVNSEMDKNKSEVNKDISMNSQVNTEVSKNAKSDNVYVKIPTGFYNLISDILNDKSDKLKLEFEQCKF